MTMPHRVSRLFRGVAAAPALPGWDTAIPAAPGCWCQEGKDDIVDSVVGFPEDPGVQAGCPILAALELALVHDLHAMLPLRRGYQPFLIPPPCSHDRDHRTNS
ncbi:hypothetical protein [Streptomyces sp. NPDC002215]|uniref:hypothetical protein n=1 Tax=Streptomyces sp. NPDC002215 TaxID=3154412 RepID=UPI0033261E1F